MKIKGGPEIFSRVENESEGKGVHTYFKCESFFFFSFFFLQ